MTKKLDDKDLANVSGGTGRAEDKDKDQKPGGPHDQTDPAAPGGSTGDARQNP